MSRTKKLNLRQGMDMPKFGDGVVAGEDANEFIMKPLQAFVRMQVKQGSTSQGKLILSDTNTILELPQSSAGAPISGGSGALAIAAPMVITGVNSDTWVCATGAGFVGGGGISGTFLINKPFNLRCSVTQGNADVYDSSGVHSLVGVSYAYDGTFLKRVVSASGWTSETSYVEPAIQPYSHYPFNSATQSGGNIVLAIPASTIPVGVIWVGQYIFTNVPGAGSGLVVGSASAGGFFTSITYAGTISGGGPTGVGTLWWGGTVIYVTGDVVGNLFDLNVDGRAWSQVPLAPAP